MSDQLRNTVNTVDVTGQKIGGRFAADTPTAPDLVSLAFGKPSELVEGQKILYQADSLTNEVPGVIVEISQDADLGVDGERYIVQLHNSWDSENRWVRGARVAATRFSLVADGKHIPGLDVNGFAADGSYRDTGRKSNDRGFKKDGFHSITGTLFDTRGFNANLEHRTGGTLDIKGYDFRGRDEYGYDRRGFDSLGNHYDTGTSRDLDGLDIAGMDEEHFDSAGINLLGFDRRGIHSVTFTRYDKLGFDVDGWNENGIHVNGYDRTGHYPQEAKLTHVVVTGQGFPRPTDEHVSALNKAGVYVFQNDASFFVTDRHGTFTKLSTREEADELAASRLGPWN